MHKIYVYIHVSLVPYTFLAPGIDGRNFHKFNYRYRGNSRLIVSSASAHSALSLGGNGSLKSIFLRAPTYFINHDFINRVADVDAAAVATVRRETPLCLRYYLPACAQLAKSNLNYYFAERMPRQQLANLRMPRCIASGRIAACMYQTADVKCD